MRLIDADALTNHKIDELCYPIMCKKCTFFQPYDEKCLLEIWVDDAPTIDAVEVVRCKDCKYVRNIESEWICEHLSGMVGLNVLVNADDFCSYGERSEE